MKGRLDELAARRAALLAETRLQRRLLGHAARDMETRLAGVDRGIARARRIVSQPLVIAGAIALIAYVGPGRLVRALGRSAALLSTGRRVLGLIGR